VLKPGDIIKGNSEIGVGLALKDGKNYIFFLAGKKHQCPPGKIFFAGIGGHLEKGESLIQCAYREAREEAEMEIEIVDSRETFFISGEEEIKKLQVEEKIKPWVLYKMIYPPETKWEGNKYFIFIFQARLKGNFGKLDEREIGGLVSFPPEQVLASLSGEKTWKEYKKGGVQLIAGGFNLKDETLLFPLGTARALGIILTKIRG